MTRAPQSEPPDNPRFSPRNSPPPRPVMTVLGCGSRGAFRLYCPGSKETAMTTLKCVFYAAVTAILLSPLFPALVLASEGKGSP